jgi:hypothetical protein
MWSVDGTIQWSNFDSFIMGYEYGLCVPPFFNYGFSLVGAEVEFHHTMQIEILLIGHVK